MKKKRRIDKNYFLLFLVTIVLISPLISKNYFIGHDTPYHIANIDSLFQAIREVNFSKIIPIIANDFGYGSSIFYPKFPHYFTAFLTLFLSFFKNPIIYAVKLGNTVTILFSGILMYELCKNIFKNKNASLLSAIFYMTMPYFMADIYARGAYNESFIFLFMPLIFIGLIALLQDKKRKFYICFILGYIGLINSHLVLSVYFTIFTLLFIFVHIKSYLIRKRFFPLLLAAIIILITVLPTVIMLIEHQRLGIYGVFSENLMWSSRSTVSYKVLSWKDYIIPHIEFNGLCYFLCPIVLIFSLLGILKIRTERDENRKCILVGILLFVIFSFLFGVCSFVYQILPKLLLAIQFPSRNVSFTGFGLSILAGYGFLSIKESHWQIIQFLSIILCLITALVCINFQHFMPLDTSKNDPNTGMGFQKEYLTQNALDHIQYFEERDHNVRIVSGDKNLKIKVLKDKVPMFQFKVDKVDKDTILELPRLYYLGYDIQVQSKDKTERVAYSLSKNGFINIKLSQSSVVTVDYKGTSLYCFFRTIRIIFYVVLIITLSLLRFKRRT